MAAPLLSPLSAWQPGTAGTFKKLVLCNLTYSTGNVFYPTTVAGVHAAGKKAQQA